MDVTKWLVTGYGATTLLVIFGLIFVWRLCYWMKCAAKALMTQTAILRTQFSRNIKHEEDKE